MNCWVLKQNQRKTVWQTEGGEVKTENSEVIFISFDNIVFLQPVAADVFELPAFTFDLITEKCPSPVREAFLCYNLPLCNQFGNVMLLNSEIELDVCSRLMMAFISATTSGYFDARLLSS